MSEETTETTETTNQETNETEKAASDEQIDYGALLANPEFMSALKPRVDELVSAQVRAAYSQMEQTAVDTRAESEKLAQMTADERAKYFEKKYRDEKSANDKKTAVAQLKEQTSALFAEKKIPPELLNVFDFGKLTADEIAGHIGVLSKYEFYEQGKLETEVERKLSERLKQAPPTTNTANSNTETEDFKKMSITEKMKLKAESPEKYKKLNENIGGTK
jgi:hypothetical protein